VASSALSGSVRAQFAMISQGGISKATKKLNVSEDVFAGMDATLRGHAIKYYIIPYHAMSYHAIPYHTIPYRSALSPPKPLPSHPVLIASHFLPRPRPPS
jgi:hypothetical protein